MSDFPVDDVTLDVLVSACAVDPEDGRSHLFDVLDFGGVHYSPHQVITSLAEEIKRIRHDDDQVDDESFHKGYDLGVKHGKEQHLKEEDAERQALSRDTQVVTFDGWGRIPTDADLDAIDASPAAECHVLKGGDGGMVLVRDLTAELRRLREAVSRRDVDDNEEEA